MPDQRRIEEARQLHTAVRRFLEAERQLDKDFPDDQLVRRAEEWLSAIKGTGEAWRNYLSQERFQEAVDEAKRALGEDRVKLRKFLLEIKGLLNEEDAQQQAIGEVVDEALKVGTLEAPADPGFDRLLDLILVEMSAATNQDLATDGDVGDEEGVVWAKIEAEAKALREGKPT